MFYDDGIVSIDLADHYLDIILSLIYLSEINIKHSFFSLVRLT